MRECGDHVADQCGPSFQPDPSLTAEHLAAGRPEPQHQRGVVAIAGHQAEVLNCATVEDIHGIDTPLYRLKTPPRQVAVVLTALGSWAGSFRR